MVSFAVNTSKPVVKCCSAVGRPRNMSACILHVLRMCCLQLLCPPGIAILFSFWKQKKFKILIVYCSKPASIPALCFEATELKYSDHNHRSMGTGQEVAMCPLGRWPIQCAYSGQSDESHCGGKGKQCKSSSSLILHRGKRRRSESSLIEKYENFFHKGLKNVTI